jgi:hypothetical protein
MGCGSRFEERSNLLYLTVHLFSFLSPERPFRKYFIHSFLPQCSLHFSLMAIICLGCSSNSCSHQPSHVPDFTSLCPVSSLLFYSFLTCLHHSPEEWHNTRTDLNFRNKWLYTSGKYNVCIILARCARTWRWSCPPRPRPNVQGTWK